MKRNKFSLSHYKLLTGDMGELLPIGLTEVLPGDTIQQATSALIRVSPLLAPVMHPVHVRIHHWFVPHRLIWEDFEDFITGGPDGNDASVLPTVTFGAGGPEIGTLADYLGVPTDVAAGISVSALPFRAYALIWNEWYADQDLETQLAISLASGPDATTSLLLQHAPWEKDYFTTARLTPQKGSEVSLPLGASAPVTSAAGIKARAAAGADQADKTLQLGSTGVLGYSGGAIPVTQDMIFPSTSGIIADLSAATSATIRQLREAFALQRYAENRARYGSRYTEYLRSLGVMSSDARLQRPEYLGGGKQTIQFSEVLQTGVTTSGDPDNGVGEMRGHGIGAMRSNRYRKYFEEHGYIVSLISVKPKTMYAQGLPRHFSRATKEDFFQHELQHIGAQEVYNKELYAHHANPNGVFGYQDRYDEYRRLESGIAGEFRSVLDHWHMARMFTADPALNASFISSVPTKRIHAVESNDVLWIMANHSIQARRNLAKDGTPI